MDEGSSVGTINITLSETNIVGFDIADLSLTRQNGSTTGNLLTGSQSLSSSGSLWSLSGLNTITTAVGLYRLTLNTAQSSNIADLAGNLLSASGSNAIVTWTTASWTNPVLSVDVNNNGVVEPTDVLTVINFINSHTNFSVDSLTSPPPPYYDVDADKTISPIDVIRGINYINSHGSSNRSSTNSLSNPTVNVTLKVTDLNGTEVNSAFTGDDLLISAYAAESDGVPMLASFADLLLPSQMQVVSIQTGTYNDGVSTNNLGDFNYPVAPDPLKLFTVRVHVVSSGSVQIQLRRATEPNFDLAYILGSDVAVDPLSVNLDSRSFSMIDPAFINTNGGGGGAPSS